MIEPIHIPSLTDAQLDEVLLGVNDHSRIIKTMALVEVTCRAIRPFQIEFVKMRREMTELREEMRDRELDHKFEADSRD